METIEAVLETAKWNPDPVQLQDLQDSPLPLMVKLQKPDTDLGPGVDTSAPFLLYSRRRRTKVYAECMGLEPGKNTMEPYGPILEIPKDYTG